MKNASEGYSSLKTNALLVFCAVATTALFGMILSIHSLSPVNDHQFIVSLFQGEPFGSYVDRSLGRFTPLSSQEYVLISKWLGPSSFLFHLLHALQAALCGAILLYCLMLTRAKHWIVAVLWLTVVGSIGFLYSSAILQAGELNALFLISLFTASTLLREGVEGPVPSRFIMLTFVGLLSLAVAFLYKETIFLMALVFGCCEFVRFFRLRVPHIPLRVWAVMAIGAAYLLFYFMWHGLQMKGSYAELHNVPRLELLRAYSKNDPLMVFVALPLALVRALILAVRPARHTVFDSFLLTSVAYSAAFLVLGMYTSYYLLPAYGFAACGIAGILESVFFERIRLVIGLICLYLTANNLPVGAADFEAAKRIANNHQEFISAISEWIWENPTTDGKPRNIVLEGVSPGSLVEIVFSLKRYLESTGLEDSAFEIRTTEPVDNEAIAARYGLKDSAGYKPKIGDILVYNPFQTNIMPPPLLAPSARPIFRSGAEYVIPRWTLRMWWSECLRSFGVCQSKLGASMPYTGYAAMLMTRAPAVVSQGPAIADDAYRIGPLELPQRLRAGTSLAVRVLFQNSGTSPWPAATTPESSHIVDIGYLWLNEKGNTIASGPASRLPEAIQPGDISEVSLVITAPRTKGKYVLVISPLQEDVRWFYSSSQPHSGGVTNIEVF